MHPKYCCKDKKCDPGHKVEDKNLRCKSCYKKLDGCCCHDYPGHFMSVQTEQCKKETIACCEVKQHPPLPTRYCPDIPKLPFHFFQYTSSKCHKPKHQHMDKKLPPLTQNKNFPKNLHFTGRASGSGCGCSEKH